MKGCDKFLHALLNGEGLKSGASRLMGSEAERFSRYKRRLALEGGLHPLFLQDVLRADRDKPLGRISAVMEAGESLHRAGFAHEELQLVMKDCLLKDLESKEIERVVQHVRGKLSEGLDSQTIRNELWHIPGPAST